MTIEITSLERVAVAIWVMCVVGIDGCRGGWIAVLWRASVEVHFWPTLDHLREVPDATVVAIDIPIGLSDTGIRRCDALARRELPGRASTIFNAPARACLTSIGDYARANEISRVHSTKGLSRQSFGLLKKIREVDDYWRTSPVPLFEVHPELSFACLNAGVPLTSKTTRQGAQRRRELLASQGIIVEERHTFPLRVAGGDDVLDAAACAWSARRISEGDARCLPEIVEFDATGREMSIRY